MRPEEYKGAAVPTGLRVCGWQQLRHPDGFEYWEKIMPRIDDRVLDVAVYLFEDEKAARRGVNIGGSGALVGVPYYGEKTFVLEIDEHSVARPGPHHLYAVTNRHVIDKGCPVVRLNTNDGLTCAIPLKAKDWISHPDGHDLAIAPLGPRSEYYQYKFLGAHPPFFLTPEGRDNMRVGAGDEAFMVGRFMGRENELRNTPVVRFGHLAAAQTELVDQTASGAGSQDHHLQESFLVEVHSISGFSGSPVFVLVPAYRAYSDSEFKKHAQGLRPGARLAPVEIFLGIDWGHVDETQFPGMAGVVPAWKLLELLHNEKVIQMRQEQEKKTGPKFSRLDVHGPTQRTRQEAEIPIPSRKDFLRDLNKATRRRPSQSGRRKR